MVQTKKLSKPSILFLISRQLGLILLEDTLKDGAFEIKAVITHYFEPDQKTPRQLFNKFAEICDKNGIPLIIIGKNNAGLGILKEVDFDFFVANCWRNFLPERYRKLAKIAALNMHRSLLPKHRGIKPLRQALADGSKNTGTTIHYMTDSIDSGEIVDQYEIKIEESDTEETLFEKLYPTQYILMKRGLLKILKRDYNRLS